jgi:predicted permease
MHTAQYDQDLAEEMRLHLELRAAEKEADGLPADAARAAAQRQFGNTTSLHEQGREARGWPWFDSLQQDLRYGFRSLKASPAFALTAVLSLALGIGANTAIFSIVNAVMLRTLPVEDPRALVEIKQGEMGELTNPIWEQIRDRQHAFSGTLAYSEARFDLADGGESHFAQGMWVSGDFFRVLGVPAFRGRVFNKYDDRQGVPALAVISYVFWQRRYAGDPTVMGKILRLNRRPFEIVGVTPPWFTGLNVDRGFDVAIPIACEPLLHPDRSALDSRSNWWLNVLGRLRPEESFAQAAARMNLLAPDVNRATLPPDWNPQDQAEYLKNLFALSPAARGFSETGSQYRSALFLLMAIAGLVLLIASANVANLLLARAAARQREIAVRMAIGASRARIVRQLLTESLLLSLLGTGGGFLLALAGSRLLIHLLSTTANPLAIDLSPDLRVFAFTLAAAVLTALLFGLAPAFLATRVELERALKENARTATPGASRFDSNKALIVGQVALSLMLLVGSGLFLGTLRNLLTIDPGFQRQNVLVIGADFQQASVPNSQRVRVYSETLERLRALPGVVSASSSAIVPISGRGWNDVVQAEGFNATSFMDGLAFFNRISPEYFKTMRTPMLVGREFDAHDDSVSRKVAIINESAARHFFGSVNAIGKTIRLDRPRDEHGGPDLYEVIGVVKDAKYFSIEEKPARTIYLLSAQDDDPPPNIAYEVRSSNSVERLIPSIRAAIAAVNRDASLEFRNFETQVSDSLLRPRVVAILSAAFGLLALLLAMIGLYGVTNYAVERRKSEIGIRLALGQQRSAVVWLMLRGVALLLLIGILCGVAASLAAGRLVTGLLYGIRPNDPRQVGAAVFILAFAAGLAAYLPARRAARLDPMAALREE